MKLPILHHILTTYYNKNKHWMLKTIGVMDKNFKGVVIKKSVSKSFWQSVTTFLFNQIDFFYSVCKKPEISNIQALFTRWNPCTMHETFSFVWGWKGWEVMELIMAEDGIGSEDAGITYDCGCGRARGGSQAELVPLVTNY